MVTPTEFVVSDQLDECPYLPDRQSRLPLRLPTAMVGGAELDERLAEGDRRTGPFFYRPACPGCRRCEPIRLDVREFRPRTTQRRVDRKGRSFFEVTVGKPQVDRRRLELFNSHREGRNLALSEGDITPRRYHAFLVETCCDTIEICYHAGGELVAVAIGDRGAVSLSAVYCYYDLKVARYSPGTFSVLTQIRLCREWGLRYLYLGYYVADSPHMAYKAGFLPHERLIDGQWRRFDH